ncbi:MAG: N-acetyltransferase [Clostridia bacterium]|nr:N-acetyltransferase [Clostridia bacterium]
MQHVTFRLETPLDYANSEFLIREAFWNVYQPGCEEHFIVHNLRGDPQVVESLNLVCTDPEGQLIGHIFYTRSQVQSAPDTSWPVLTFGPISVHPTFQKKGIGSELIRRSMASAKEMGFPGILITGNPAYYHRFGFRPASDYGIVFQDGSSFPELMACELSPGALDNVHGRLLFCPQFSNVDPVALEAFDLHFPPKTRLKKPGQLH